MRRDVLHSSISKIIKDIKECEIFEFFEMFMNQVVHRETKNTGVFPLKAFQKYMIATNNYNENEIEICKIVGIEQILEVQFWQSLSELEDSGEVHSMFRNIQFTINQLPKILSLIKQDYVLDIKEQKGSLPEELKGKSLLTVLIVENEGQFSSPLRLTSALSAISDLYSVVATIEKRK